MASKPCDVTVHPFTSPTPSACAYERGNTSSRNALVYIDGLTGGPHRAQHLNPLIEALQADPELSYSFWEFRMRSSYTGFGFSSLANDVEDISALVTHLRELGKENIVLLGSSTGCQGILTYVSSDASTPVNAYILQAPTSDRELGSLLVPADFLAQTLKHAEEMIARGEKDEIMPKSLIPPIFSSPVTAYRWHSLIAKGGDDDFFSSDLADEALVVTFGKLDKPTLIIPSENDEMVPPTVDKKTLLQRWIKVAPEGMVSELSGLNPGADHQLSEEGTQLWFTDRVLRFLKTLN
ncbi:hypothetical protein HBH70_097230 [Parastagonospora nodorum]|nr:hypothetical protein HBH46_105370 [Parastagonospora nodorum]KAH5074693.1 hypothetical protein HBH95_143630 [Parastagonospora nodorum]KAH5115877.1 hypothetical protein HBH71_127670 [Parastagonospora nodorum]KAH5138839.1 hypothetical protein HBH70_097230 [Parastagonospora nodorum]KAH5582730.1 hypothetical protein HBI26_122160 [Parastagonospora nodorum]